MATVTTITRTGPLVFGWLVAWWLLWRLPRPERGAAAIGPVSVVVPARDEADNLPVLLASLAVADAPGGVAFEVIVVEIGRAHV